MARLFAELLIHYLPGKNHPHPHLTFAPFEPGFQPWAEFCSPSGAQITPKCPFEMAKLQTQGTS